VSSRIIRTISYPGLPDRIGTALATTLRGALILASLLGSTVLEGQQLRLPANGIRNDSTLPSSIAILAREAIAIYADKNRDRYLDNLGRLQTAAGEFDQASRTFDQLQLERLKDGKRKSAIALVPYELYATAKQKQISRRMAFADALHESYGEVAATLDDSTAAYELWWALGTYVPRLENNLREAVLQRTPNDVIAIADGIDLVRRFVAASAYRSMSPFLERLQAEDDARRYFIDRDVLVRTPDGARICVLVMRPRSGTARLPALLNFSIYADANHTDEARLSASHGYAGVSALSRGKGCSPDMVVPFERDGADAAAVIGWIARQRWSDGRVGMYGGSYDGFAQWAALKHHPPALKAVMPSVTADPGLGFPMEGGVFMNYAYPYPFYVTDTRGLDDAVYNDTQRWDRLDSEWYKSGRAYSSLDSIDGTPNPIFHKWLAHPAYDKYWQDMIPFEKEFATVDIPVLTTTGYYDSGQEGALYYFTQHYNYNPGARHYLVIGPYDHIGGQRGTISPLGTPSPTLRGYSLDSAAQIEIPGRLRYEWFAYIFKGGVKPSVLKNRVNYEVMGADRWKHVPSVAAMGPRRIRLFLSDERAGPHLKLRSRRASTQTVAVQTVNLADRNDAEQPIIDQALDTWNIIDDAPHIGNAISFVTDAYEAPIEVSGRFSGRLSFITNKKDFDFSVTLFELTPQGKYFQLSYYWSRASLAKDRTRRQLLIPGKPQQLNFESGRLTSRQFQPGSRLVVVIGVIKQPGEQINYGTGKDVSSETIADASEPLRIEWLRNTSITVPLGR
jgi:uncharacterized protein